MDRTLVLIGSIVMFIAVGAGAFGAHGLSGYFMNYPDLRGTYETAVQYQMIHGIAIFIAAWMATRYDPTFASWAGYLFLLGMVLFSGSLYLLVFTRTTWFGAITPLGGVAFLAGWVLLALAAWRAPT
ncbi:MAG: DUF423 domain-containing protein [Candidatus Promineifilaceae bacterium]